MTRSLVQARGVGLRFGAVEAVRDVSLSLQSAQITTLVGPSGCGKSSVLRMVAGLTTPSHGSITLQPGLQKSFVFQDAALMPWARVQDNVVLPLKLAGRDVSPSAVSAALERVGLEGRETAYPSELSGGMKMRVSIARALISEPDLLLMDEPFAALDEMRRFDLAQQVRSIAKAQSLAILFVTHSVFEACFLSDTVLVMSAQPGSIIERIDVDGPDNRSADFRESAAFAQAASAVSKSLRAGSEHQETEEAL